MDKLCKAYPTTLWLILNIFVSDLISPITECDAHYFTDDNILQKCQNFYQHYSLSISALSKRYEANTEMIYL